MQQGMVCLYLKTYTKIQLLDSYKHYTSIGPASLHVYKIYTYQCICIQYYIQLSIVCIYMHVQYIRTYYVYNMYIYITGNI